MVCQGNSGTQSLAVSVRNISTGEINEQSKFKIALRSGSGLLSGIVCAVILFLIIVVIFRQPLLALIGGSLTCA